MATTIDMGSQGVEAEKDLEQLCINTIRTLSIDAVQKANSGHPVFLWAQRLWLIRFGLAS